MIVPFIMRSEPGTGQRQPRQTASFTNEQGLAQTIELSRSEEFIVEDLVGDLMIAYVFDLPTSFRHVNRKDCLDLGLRHDELRALSVRNLVHRRPRPVVQKGPGVAMLVLDENLESSLLLVDHLWDQFEPQLPGEMVATVPARHLIVVTGTGIPGGIEALERATDMAWNGAEPRRRLTRSPLVRRGKSWHMR